MTKIRAVWCALFGHTRATDACMGYQYCARCKAQVGDTLGGVGRSNPVGMHCGCNDCRDSWGSAKWHERVLLPNQPRFTGLTQQETRNRHDRELAEMIAGLKAETERRRAAK